MLKIYSYYDLVNGNLDKLMVHRHPDIFQDGISIKDLVKIRVIEDRIKSIFLKQILMIEKSFKTTLSYYISKEFGVNQHAGGYLSKKNYSDARKDIVSDTMKRLRKICEGKVRHPQGDPIVYYREQHNHIPPWILVEELTLGQTIYWYKCLKTNGKKTIDNELLHLPSNLSQEKIANLFLDSTNILREFRNFFAHNSVLSHMQSNAELDLTLFLHPHRNQTSLIDNIPNNLANSHNLVACFLSILVLSRDFDQAQIFISDLKQTINLLANEDEAKFIFEDIFHIPIFLIENGEKFINKLPKFL
uniref:Abi family protein n=1 Tax=Lentilactobacillus hilgardii TaxID=1588 RepID=UPI00403F0B9E